MNALATLYANSVKAGDRKIEQVPAVIRPEVQKILDQK
ncbi:CD1375 family protein [Secundilactobacillus yichangensis]|nr:CD1375 family protein [Secundilactobacillus yichangensis]